MLYMVQVLSLNEPLVLVLQQAGGEFYIKHKGFWCIGSHSLIFKIVAEIQNVIKCTPL